MKPYYLPAILVSASALVWGHARFETARLQDEVEALRDRHRSMLEVRREHAALLAKQPTATELEQLRADAEAAARLAEQVEARKSKSNVRFAVGEWVAAEMLRNAGTATPRATVETALWAAAGGDAAAFGGTFVLSDEARISATEVLAGLPEASRPLYSSPEALIAAFTLKRIPVADAQIVWLDQPDENHATACVFVKNPDVPPQQTPVAPAAASGNSPPMVRDNGRRVGAVLSLQRTGDGWRLVVPGIAMKKIVKELGRTSATDSAKQAVGSVGAPGGAPGSR